MEGRGFPRQRPLVAPTNAVRQTAGQPGSQADRRSRLTPPAPLFPFYGLFAVASTGDQDSRSALLQPACLLQGGVTPIERAWAMAWPRCSLMWP